jgi:hydroxymethylpyrimidine/phosphomethylpyrimidine kinase
LKKSLTIAGSDCSGGAGIQADLKTMAAHGVYGMSVITSLTAQNTMGVRSILDVESSFVGLQLEAIFEDIYPDSIKIGMLSNRSIVEIVVKKLRKYKARNVVLDPVLVSTSGSALLSGSAIELLKDELIPTVDLVTPNIPEAEKLSGVKIRFAEDMIKAAREISKEMRGQVLIKGGHLEDSADDLLYSESGGIQWLKSERIDNPNTHGTGCTLSSAIASNLALGYSIEESVQMGKAYINRSLSAKLDIGYGRGPLNHYV